MDLIQKNIKIFKDYCAKRKIQYDTLCEGGASAMEIIGQSRFADLLIADAEIRDRDGGVLPLILAEFPIRQLQE